jgi:hypothetical protein
MVQPGCAPGGDARESHSAHQVGHADLTELAPNESVTGAKAMAGLATMRADASPAQSTLPTCSVPSRKCSAGGRPTE